MPLSHFPPSPLAGVVIAPIQSRTVLGKASPFAPDGGQAGRFRSTPAAPRLHFLSLHFSVAQLMPASCQEAAGDSHSYSCILMLNKNF